MMFEKLESPKEFSPFKDLSKKIGGLREGDLVGIVVTDQLSHAYFLHLAVSSFPGFSYYLDLSSRLSMDVLSSLGGDPGRIFFGRVYTMGDIISSIKYVSENSLFVVGSLNALDPRKEDILALKSEISEKTLYGMVLIEEQNLNELNLPGEIRRLLIVPEVFEQILVGRISYYRGKYKLTVTVLRAYPDKLSSLGDHEFTVDEEVKKILFPNREGQQSQ
ncbi:218aa long hypothetical protein [Pyrococcus horikoshii OT3]|uniref:KaiC-like domain-containing protein n=2 Tax=Pyrococcus horikoshii TaxID=53953 RepID=O57870_PYRHO|nr:218aa long hypothetical protein [Pyrococcus horikoshii OT3]